MPATSDVSDALAKDMKKRGFKFVGSTIMYAHLQATGLSMITCVPASGMPNAQAWQRGQAFPEIALPAGLTRSGAHRDTGSPMNKPQQTAFPETVCRWWWADYVGEGTGRGLSNSKRTMDPSPEHGGGSFFSTLVFTFWFFRFIF